MSKPCVTTMGREHYYSIRKRSERTCTGTVHFFFFVTHGRVRLLIRRALARVYKTRFKLDHHSAKQRGLICFCIKKEGQL